MISEKDLTLFHIPTVWHVGNFDNKQQDKLSYEGDLLSVSECPDVWQRIARLSGNTYAMSNPDALFIDAISMWRNPKIKKHVMDWGEENSFLSQKEVYSVTLYDDMEDSTSIEVFESYEEAFANYEDESIIEGPETRLYLTDTFAQRIGLSNLSNGFEYDMDRLFIEWAKEHILPRYRQICGIWWDEILDEAGYSAPRGGVFQERLETFTTFQDTFGLWAEDIEPLDSKQYNFSTESIFLSPTMFEDSKPCFFLVDNALFVLNKEQGLFSIETDDSRLVIGKDKAEDWIRFLQDPELNDPPIPDYFSQPLLHK